MKVRVKFAKYGALKFIGHLDVMRFFQKVMRRAEIDIKYSAGYSPHPIMSFAQPLGLGITSEGEYMDIEVASTGPSAEMVERINQVCVEGIEVKSFRRLPETAGNGMSVIAAADYVIRFRENCPCPFNLQAIWNSFIAQGQIIVTKETKTKTDTLDIRPYIYQGQVEGQELRIRLACGSVMNIKPELVMQTLYEYADASLGKYDLLIHRLDLYANIGQADGEIVFISLEDMAEEITEYISEEGEKQLP